MKAAVLREVNRPLEVEDVEIADPGPREVVVRTGASGVCHSDLHFVEGLYATRFPVVLGHEAAGTVEAVGDLVDYVKPGDRGDLLPFGVLRPLRTLHGRPDGAVLPCRTHPRPR